MKIIKSIALGFCFIVIAPIFGNDIATLWLNRVATIILYNRNIFVDDAIKRIGAFLFKPLPLDARLLANFLIF